MLSYVIFSVKKVNYYMYSSHFVEKNKIVYSMFLRDSECHNIKDSLKS